MIEELIQRVAERLDKDKIPYMIIGGQAVLLYGSPSNRPEKNKDSKSKDTKSL